MSIDPDRESLLSLTEATKTLPRRRGGMKPHLSCLYRWTTTGCRGVVLESIQIGGTRCTSREALARFFHRLTNGDAAEPPSTPKPRSVAQHDRATARALKELEREGC